MENRAAHNRDFVAQGAGVVSVNGGNAHRNNAHHHRRGRSRGREHARRYRNCCHRRTWQRWKIVL
jgi:hypothetical protein